MAEGGPAERFRGLDLYNPRQFDVGLLHARSVGLILPEGAREKASLWYEHAHEGVERDVRHTDLTHRQGSGAISAVSSGMDWGAGNVHALHMMKNITESQWKPILESARRRDPETNRLMPRTGAASEMLSSIDKHYGAGALLTKTKDQGLEKAYRIMHQGEDPEDVLTAHGAPKMHSFFHNIHDPSSPIPRATIDYRAHDIIHNVMGKTDWTRPLSNIPPRGKARIGSAQPGDPSQYAKHEEVYRQLAHEFGFEHAHQAQSLVWEGGKHIETEGGTKARGPDRVGQPYIHLPHIDLPEHYTRRAF